MGRHDQTLKPGDPGHTVTSHEARVNQVRTREKFLDGMALREVAIEQAKMLTRATKQMVLEGTSYRKAFYIPQLSNLAVIIRPITDVEYGRVQDVVLEGIDLQDVGNLKSVEGIVEKERLAKYTAVAYALSCDGEEWTAEDVGKLPQGIPDQLYQEVGKISGFPRASRAGAAG